MRGAPTVSGVAGTRAPALDALLITGWGATTALAVSVAGGVGAATFNAGLSFEAPAIVAISGANEGILNGLARVLSSSSSAITFETDAPDGTYTGTIAFKYAPVPHWEHAFVPSGDVRVYRSTDHRSAGHCWRVDDSKAQYFGIVGYESMTADSAGTGLFPTAAQASAGGRIYASAIANANAVRYWLIADSLALHTAFSAMSATDSSFLNAPARGFGYAVPCSPAGDPHAAYVCAATTALSDGGHLDSPRDYVGSGGIWLARNISGAGSAVRTTSYPYVGDRNSFSGQDSTLGDYPSVVDGQGKPSKRFFPVSASNPTPRDEIPGIYHLPQQGVLANGLAPGNIESGAGDLAGRRLLVLGTNSPHSSGAVGAYLMDITGDWRA